MFKYSFFSFFIFLFSFHPINAQESEKTVSITVSGSGKTQDEAKQSALRSAIEQAFGAFISSKTEMLNDQVVADQMASVSNGNIQSYSILNESQLPDGGWANTIKAIVSVSKLTSFVESKGITVEIKGSLFALNIKQQLLNEDGEFKAVSEMVGLLHESMQTSFDYSLKCGDPKSLDSESKNWEIPIVVTATTNQNIDFCAKYCINILSAISLSFEEMKSYKNLNKTVFSVIINYNGINKVFYLRKKSSLMALNTLASNWKFYTHLFIVKSGLNESLGKVESDIHNFSSFSNNLDKDFNDFNIYFLTKGQQAGIFSWNDTRTIKEIEQMSEYKVTPKGVVSNFMHGGFVVYEKNGHGLIAAVVDLESKNYKTATTDCDNLSLCGYSDWHLPTKEELNYIYTNLHQNGIGGFMTPNFIESIYHYNKYANCFYLTSTEYSTTGNWIQEFQKGSYKIYNQYYDDYFYFARPVRSF